MKELSIKITAVLLALVSVSAVMFSSCGKDDESQLVFKKGGKTYYRTQDGEAAYELVTDSNGETVVDKEGNMLWKVTDAEGKEQTHPVSFPSYINDGRKVSCQQFTMTLPSGWTNNGNLKIILKSKDEGMTIDYSFYEDATSEERIEDIRQLVKDSVDKKLIKLTENDCTVAGRKAKMIVIDCDKTEVQSYSELYFIDTDGGCMAFMCAVDDYADAGKAKFKSVLDSIEYRV